MANLNLSSKFVIPALLVLGTIVASRISCSHEPSALDSLTSDQILVEMERSNQQLLSQTIAHIQFGKLDERVGEELETNLITKSEAERKRVRAVVLVADTLLKQGLDRGDSGPLRVAYPWLQELKWEYEGSELWRTTRFEVPQTARAPARFPWKDWSLEELHARVVDELQERNRKGRIWGFIPGGYHLMDALVRVTGAVPSFSYGFAAFLLALIVRTVVYPLAQRQLMWSRQMAQLRPESEAIKQRFQNPQEQQAKLLELCKDYGVSPLGGCLPALIQIPLFMLVYNCMLLYEVAFSNGTFLWINPATSWATNGIVAPNLGQVDYILIAVYALSLVLSTFLSGATDSEESRKCRIIGYTLAVAIPVFMTFEVLPVPAAFVLYWTFANILATAQNLRAHRLPLRPLVKLD